MACSSKPKGIYDAFLSFRGADLRNNFIGHLYQALDRNGIYTFRDSEELKKGDQILPMLRKAIEESYIAIIVFSKDYASSRWCLEELAKIMDHKEQKKLTVLPVFYKVEPREVREGRSSYKSALDKHESKFGKDSEKVKRWKEALFSAGSLSGWHLTDGDESKLIQTIVKEISNKLDRKPLHVAKHPVGMDSQVAKLKTMLNLDSDDGVLMVGLWGQGGIGKTSLAKALFNALFRQFEGSCFLANVRETSKACRGLVILQEILLNDILLPKRRLEVSSVDRGINLIQHRLGRKKVLVILDDVDDLSQLNALAGEGDWYGDGSRIIITTRDKQWLTCHKIDRDHVYDVKALDDNEAHKLLSNHAFPTHRKLQIKKDLVDRVVTYAKGLPLALEVLGSFLCGRGEDAWESTLKEFSRIPNSKINDVLKISYDGLEENEKEIFLHIACFFKGWRREYVKKILDSCGFEVAIILERLIERSLVSIEQCNENVYQMYEILQVHDLIQLMGMNIVNQECRDDPRRRSRLWQYDDVVKVLSRDMGDCAVKAIVLDLPKPIEMCISPDAFTKMQSLKFLILRNVRDSFQGRLRCLPSELRWFEWPGCASWRLSSPLVGLNMSKGNIREVVKQLKALKNLTYINFNGCESPVCLPDLSCIPYLEELDLQCCKSLVEAHESIAYHDKLRVLNLGGCSELSVFPNELKSKNLRVLILDGCTKFERFPNIPHELEGMEEVYLQGTAIKELPTSIENLVSLEQMHLNICKNLVSLPSSIYKLQKLKMLGLGNCTNFIRFPKHEDSADPCMKTGLSNLIWLFLGGCNLSEVEFLENLSCFPRLEELCLGGKNITSLPPSINERNSLYGLDFSNCPQLEITELPPTLSWLWADNSESLRNNEGLIHHFVRRGLDIDEIDICSLEDEKASLDFNICFFKGEMPEWFLPGEGGFVSFRASKDLYDKIFGLLFCFILNDGREVDDEEDLIFEIITHVNGERRACKNGRNDSFSSFEHGQLRYYLPYELWGDVNFGQINGSHVQFSLTVSTTSMKQWGLRIICKPLEDALKVEIPDDFLRLLREVVLESTYSEDESSFMHEDSSTEADLQKELQDSQRSTEKHSQTVSKRNHKLILPQGTLTPVQPPEVQSSTNSGEQTNARTFGVGDIAADEPEPEPINDLSATGSGTAPASMSTVTPTTSIESMPSQGAAETVDFPSAQPSLVAEESTSEVSDVEVSDLEAIDEFLGEVKPRSERPLQSGSDSSTPGSVSGVRAKCEELYQLTEEGYSQIATNSCVKDRIKNLLAELSSGDDCFTKTPEFQYNCKEFAMFFANDIEVFRQNCDKIESSTAVEESLNKLEDRLKAGRKILKERRSSYQAAINKTDELPEEKERPKALPAEVKRQIELNHTDIRREGKSMKQQFREVVATKQERDRQQAEVDRHLPIKKKCMEDNKTLDERLSTFRRNVKRRLDDM